MTANPQCPLDPFAMLQLENKMNLARVLEIENHISSSSCLHPPLKDIVLHGTLDGSTPLILACEQGDLKSVQHIVDVWGADVRAAANFYYSGEKIEEASPIFVAALKRHVEILQYLISKDADVSAITSTKGNRKYAGITPLQVALDYQHTEDKSREDFCVEKSVIVELLLEAGANPSTLSPDGDPMWCYCDNGFNSIMALINHGIDVNLRSTYGETILHCWISRISDGVSLDIPDKEKFFVDVVKLLLARGVDLMAKDREGFTPITCISLADQLKWYWNSGPTLPSLLGILEVLLERPEIDAIEKIDAMELAGARLIFALEPEKAFHYWRRALLLRDSLSNNPKIPLQMTSAGRAEWITLEQLENVIRDPSVWWVTAEVAMLRIYADRSFEAIFFNQNNLAFYNEVEKAPKMTQSQISDLLLETLGVILRFDPKEHHRLWEYKKDIMEELIFRLPSTLGNDVMLPNVECERIVSSLQLVRKLILEADPLGGLKRNLRAPGRVFNLRYSFFSVLAGVPAVWILHEDVWKFLSESVRQPEVYNWNSGQTIVEGTKLAQACEKKDWKTLRLLLHLQADPNEEINWQTKDGNGPLHLVADLQDSSEMECTPASLLFEYGADPYRKNAEGKTAVDIWIERNCGVEGIQSPKWNRRPDWCRNTVPNPKLSCLAAKTIHAHRIPYTRPGDLPVNLIRFLENH